MTTITSPDYEQLMRVLRNSYHPEAIEAARKLRISHMESMARELTFNNEAPALCRAQIG